VPDELTVSVSIHAQDRWRKRGAEWFFRG